MTKIVLQDLEFIHPTLRSMFRDLEQMHGEQTITSLYRIGDKGVHGQLPLRGIDVRCRDPLNGAAIENSMNAIWQYDPERPGMKCCIFHDVGQGAHIHLQCHPNTVKLI